MSHQSTRRWAIHFVVALAILSALVTALYFLLPTVRDTLNAQTDRVLSEAFGAPASVGSSRFSLDRRGLCFSAETIRTTLAEGRIPLRIARASLYLRILPLISGNIRIRQIDASGLELSIPTDYLATLAQTEALPSTESSPWAELERTWTRSLTAFTLPKHVSELHLSDSAIAIATPPSPDHVQQDILLLNNLEAQLRRRPLRHATSVELSATLVGGSEESGLAEISLEGMTRHQLQGKVTFQSFEVTQLAPLFEASPTSARILRDWAPDAITGLIGFEIGAHRGGNVNIDLEGTTFRLPIEPLASPANLEAKNFHIYSKLVLPELKKTPVVLRLDSNSEFAIELTDVALLSPATQIPQREWLATKQLNATGKLSFDGTRLRFDDTAIEVGGQRIAVSSSFETPFGMDASIELAATCDDLEFEELFSLEPWIPVSLQPTFSMLHTRVKGGTFKKLSAYFLGTLRAAERSWQTRDFQFLPELQAELVNGKLQLEGNESVDSMHAQIRFREDTLEIHQASAVRNGKPFPVLDLRLEGVGQIWNGDPAQRMKPLPTAQIPGLIPLLEILFGGGHEGPPGQPTHLTIDWIESPTLLWPVRNVDTLIVPDEAGIHFANSSITWGGTLMRVDGRWKRGPDPNLALDLQAVGIDPTYAAERDEKYWIQGHWQIENAKIGPWPYRYNRGTFRGRGTIAEVTQEIAVAPKGELHAKGELFLEQKDHVGIRADINLQDGDLETLSTALTKEESRIFGSLGGTVSAKGKLVPNESILRFIDASGELRAENGQVRTHVPLLLAIIKASKSFNPFGTREWIRYESIEGKFSANHGVMKFEPLALNGPDLRLLISGTIDVLDAEKPVDFMVGVLLFETVDTVISMIPIIHRILLGPDKNLLGTYFSVTGPRNDLRASMIPTKTLVFGPAEFAFKQLPDLVTRTFKGRGNDASKDEDAESTPEPTSPAPKEGTTDHAQGTPKANDATP